MPVSHPLINRREFVGHLTRGALVASLGGATLELSGCNVFTDILNWIPTAETVLDSITTLLAANGYPISQAAAAIVATTKAALAQLVADVKIYQAISPPPVGALAKIQAIFGIVVSNYQAFLQAINVPNSPLLSTIVGLAEIVFSTIAGFLNRLPTPPAAANAQTVGATFRVAGQSFSFAPVERSRRAFKKACNGVLDGGAKAGVMVPQSAYFHLSLFERL